MISNTTKGFIFGSVASASYGLNPLFALPLYAGGMDADSVLFYRYGFAVVILGILMRLQKQSFKISKKEILPLFIMGMLFSFSSLFLFLAYNYMDAGIASTIIFIYPVMVAIIMALFFKEKLTMISMTSIVLTFVGVGLLCKNSDGTHLSIIGTTFVALSALSYAIYIVGINKSSLKNLPITKLTFYVLLFGLLVYFVRLNFGTNLVMIDTPNLYFNAICLAIFPTIVSLITMTKSIKYIGSTPTAILGALEPITALVIGVTIFNEQLTSRIVFGVFLILFGVTLIIGGKSILNSRMMSVLLNKKQ